MGTGGVQQSQLTEPRIAAYNEAGALAHGRTGVGRGRDTDEFSVTDYEGSIAASSMYSVERARQRRELVKRGLSALPAPEYTYEVSMPQVESAAETAADTALDLRPRDRAEVEAEARKTVEAERQAALARRSTAVKLGLPLPAHLTPVAQQVLSRPVSHLAPELQTASSLVSDEMCKVLSRDCWRYWDPSNGGQRPQEADAVELLPDAFLARAHEQVQHEVANRHESFPAESFAAQWDLVHDGSFAPGKRISNVSTTNGNTVPFLNCLEREHCALKDRVVADGRRCKVLEEQIRRRSTGTIASLEAAASRVESEYARYSELSIEISSLRKLQEAETRSIAARIARSKEDLQELLDLENALQRRYAVLQAI